AVRGDRALIEGILNNLVDNALSYGTTRPDPRVTLAVTRQAGGIELSVTDNGAGLPSAQLEQLKKRWVQGEQGRRIGKGAGLGLAIVVRYAELLGAPFTLAGLPGGGV